MLLALSALFLSAVYGQQWCSCLSGKGRFHCKGQRKYDFAQQVQIHGIEKGWSWEGVCGDCAELARDEWIKSGGSGKRCFYCNKDLFGIYMFKTPDLSSKYFKDTQYCGTATGSRYLDRNDRLEVEAARYEAERLEAEADRLEREAERLMDDAQMVREELES